MELKMIEENVTRLKVSNKHDDFLIQRIQEYIDDLN